MYTFGDDPSKFIEIQYWDGAVMVREVAPIIPDLGDRFVALRDIAPGQAVSIPGDLQVRQMPRWILAVERAIRLNAQKNPARAVGLEFGSRALLDQLRVVDGRRVELNEVLGLWMKVVEDGREPRSVRIVQGVVNVGDAVELGDQKGTVLPGSSADGDRVDVVRDDTGGGCRIRMEIDPERPYMQRPVLIGRDGFPVADARVQEVVAQVRLMPSDDVRRELIVALREVMCLECGRLNPQCRCWDDE